MFSVSTNSMKLSSIISHQTGSGKSIEITFPPNRKWKTNMVKISISGTENKKLQLQALIE